MSVPGNRLTENSLKAPSGQFRVVKKQPKLVPNGSPAFYLVADFAERHEAIKHWRDLMLERRHSRQDGLRYTVYDDLGRVNDAVGAFITEQECKAPTGKFRVVCVDFAGNVVLKLVTDLDDREQALEYVKDADEGPYTGFRVHDDTGKVISPTN